ncbi:MAG TPA: alpha/beta hydrolase-fold protein [Saprospiraceae bacterium]|nr:alpha/beta hydrolase-fold protein [Saprospiraceae bacterium]
MKYLALLYLTILCFYRPCAQNDSILLGFRHQFYSGLLQEQRTLSVYLPASYSLPSYSETGYPLLFVLDGESLFHLASGIVHHLSNIIVNPPCPEMIVVGIHQIDRNQDLSPSDSASGKGQRFLEFIEKEVIPFIDKHYRTQSYRMLGGRSLGGLCVVNALVQLNQVDSYLAIEPSLWWDSQRFLDKSQQKLRTLDLRHKSLFLAIANTMDRGLDTLTVQSDTAFNTLHMRSLLKFKSFIEAGEILPAGYKYYETENHQTVTPVALFDGLRYFFRDYPITRTSQDYDDTSFSVAQKFKKHFDMVSVLYRMELKPAEADLKGLGLHFQSVSQFRKAAELFLLNIQYYPRSPDAHATYAACLQAMGERTQAIEFYTKSLELKDQPEVRRKLEALIKP